jgi:tetratricopeptide (TPR) repeat protein
LLSALGALLFLVAVGAKMTAIVLPLLILLALWWKQGGPSLRSSLSTVPVWIASISYGLLNFFLLNSQILKSSVDRLGTEKHSLIWRAAGSLLQYTSIALWPQHPSVSREVPEPGIVTIAWAVGILAVALLAVLLAARTEGESRWGGFGLVWFLVTLLPVVNILPIKGRPIAEQRLLLPSAGWCLALASLLVWSARGIAFRERWPLKTWAVRVGSVCYVVLHLWTVAKYIPAWRTEETFWQHVLARDANSVVGHDRLGTYYARQGDYSQSLVHLEKALELAPDDPFTLLHLGIVKAALGDATQAMVPLEQAVSAHPDFPEAFESLAAAYLRNHRPQEALEAAETAVGLDPRMIEARHTALNAAVELEDWTKAESILDSLLEISPDDAEAHVARSRILRRTGRIEEARRNIESVVERYPEYGPARAEVALIYHELGDYEKAVLAWKRALSSHDTPEWKNGLGKTLVMMGETESGIRALRDATESAPGRPGFHGDLAEALLISGSLVEAASAYRYALAAGGKDATLLGGLGVCLARLGELDNGIETLKESTRLAPGNADLKRNLGFALLQKGDLPEAVRVLEESVNLAPRSQLSWQLLAQAYVRCGSPEKAHEADLAARRLKSPDRTGEEEGVP